MKHIKKFNEDIDTDGESKTITLTSEEADILGRLLSSVYYENGELQVEPESSFESSDMDVIDGILSQLGFDDSDYESDDDDDDDDFTEEDFGQFGEED